MGDSSITEAACNRSTLYEAKDSRAHFPGRRKRSQSFLWKRHWYPACQHRRWPGSAELEPAARCSGGPLNLWTQTCLYVCAGACFLSSHACMSLNIQWLCVGQLRSLSPHIPSSCERSVWMLFLCCNIKEIETLLHSSCSLKYLWHVLNVLLHINISWTCIELLYTVTFRPVWLYWSSWVACFYQINANPLILKNLRSNIHI